MPDISKGAAAEPKQRMPTSTKVAAILLGFLSALLLFNAVVGFIGLPSILDQFTLDAAERDIPFDRGDASTQLKTSFAVSAVMALACATSVVLLARRIKAGRLLGLACATVELSLGVLGAINVGGLLPYTLLLVVVTSAILVMLLRNQTVEWLRNDDA